MSQLVTGNFDGGRSFCFSVGIPGAAGVDPRLLGVDAQDVQGHVVKVVGWSDLVTWKIQ
jgi:hypothetical protein